MKPWNDKNRYSQTGYSAPTIFPIYENYIDKRLFDIDDEKAYSREEARREWLAEEYEEGRRDYLELKNQQLEEIK